MPELLQKKIDAKLPRLSEQSLVRRRFLVDQTTYSQGNNIIVCGRNYINFSSNDYLGLAKQAFMTDALIAASSEHGVGSCASPLVTGYHQIHKQLEQTLCDMTGHEAAMLLSSGFSANHGLMTGLFDNNDYVIADKLVHASIIDGLRHSGANFKRFSHNSVSRAQTLLTKQKATALVTESVFSMDGDIAPLRDISDLCKQNDAALIVDDAHGFGVLNADSRISAEIADIQVITFGKALGCQGAAILSSKAIIDYLLNHSRDYIYSTALSPVNAAVALAACQHIRNNHHLKQKLHANIELFRKLAFEAGIQLMPSETPIQGIIIGEPGQTLEIAEELKNKGIWCGAIRIPTVPRGTDRLRMTITASHTQDQIKACIADLVSVLAKFPLQYKIRD